MTNKTATDPMQTHYGNSVHNKTVTSNVNVRWPAMLSHPNTGKH